MFLKAVKNERKNNCLSCRLTCSYIDLNRCCFCVSQTLPGPCPPYVSRMCHFFKFVKLRAIFLPCFLNETCPTKAKAFNMIITSGIHFSSFLASAMKKRKRIINNEITKLNKIPVVQRYDSHFVCCFFFPFRPHCPEPVDDTRCTKE